VNSKILIAFAAGAVIASGIVYIAVRPEDAAPLPPPVVVRSETPVSVPVAQVDSAPAAIQPPVAHEPEAAPMVVRPPVPPAPVREKPSPLHPRLRREEPVIVARSQQPPIQPPIMQPARETAPSPMPAALPKPSSDPLPQPVVPQPVVPTPVVAPAPPPPPMPPARTPNTVTIQPGTILAVRIGETISSVRNEVGDGFVATLDRPLVIDGFVIAERGARVEGRVVEAQHPGRANGPSNLGVELIEVSTSDGQRVHVRTATFKKESASSNAGDWANIVLARGKPAEIPVETRMNFRTREPITITEHLQ
jgi:hypothetical protein